MEAAGIIGFVFYLFFTFLDAMLTEEVLERGGRELNPVLRWFIGKMGSFYGILLPKVAMAAVLGTIILGFTHEFWWIGPVAALVYGYVCLRNYKVLKRLGG